MRHELPSSSCQGPVGPIWRRVTFLLFPAGDAAVVEADAAAAVVVVAVIAVVAGAVAAGDADAVAGGVVGVVVVGACVAVVDGPRPPRPLPLLGFVAISPSACAGV